MQRYDGKCVNAQVIEMVSDEDDNTNANKNGLKGQYANHFRVGHNAFEFIIDFGQFYDGNKKADFNFRTITSPAYAMELMEMLAESLREFEANFGKIEHLNNDDIMS